MKIAAFDPGIGLTGYAIVEGDRAIDYGVIATQPNTPPGGRCVQVYQDVITLLQTHQPDYVALEKPFFGARKNKNATNAREANNTNANITYYYAVGALLMAIASCGYPEPLLMAATTIKLHATGKGNAPKTAIKPAVLGFYGITHVKGTKDDAYDALAGAIAAQNLIAANAA